MKKAFIFSAFIFVFLCSCQNSNSPQASTSVEKVENHESDRDLILGEYEKIVNGFRNNDFSFFYNALDNDAITIDGSGKEMYGKQRIVSFFDDIMKNVDVELTDWKLHELIVADSLAIGRAEYTARFYDSKDYDEVANSNWHIVWKKNSNGAWKILREIYNDK